MRLLCDLAAYYVVLWFLIKHCMILLPVVCP